MHLQTKDLADSAQIWWVNPLWDSPGLVICQSYSAEFLSSDTLNSFRTFVDKTPLIGLSLNGWVNSLWDSPGQNNVWLGSAEFPSFHHFLISVIGSSSFSAFADKLLIWSTSNLVIELFMGFSSLGGSYQEWLTSESQLCMMTSSNGNIFRVTGPLCGEFTGLRWILRTKTSGDKLWCFLWSAPNQTAE